MNVVVTNSRQKEGWLQLRIDADFKREVKIVADARGLSISALVHSLLKQAVRDEREQYPQLFGRRASVKSLKEPLTVISSPAADERQRLRDELAEQPKKKRTG